MKQMCDYSLAQKLAVNLADYLRLAMRVTVKFPGVRPNAGRRLRQIVNIRLEDSHGLAGL